MPSTLKSQERWSVLDLHRHRSARSVIDHYLDRLVDIFDFPLSPSPESSLPDPSPTTRKWSASTTSNTYTTMDGSRSPRSNKTFKVSMADRLRELWLSSTCKGYSKTRTRGSVTVCNDSVASSYATPNELRKSWLPPKRSTTAKASGDDLWFECDEQDRVLECGYQCLVDEASI